ncbi:MAG: hypothetical protein RIR11_2583 [Bacteroidota bacterium]
MSTIIHHHDSALWSYRSLLNNPDLSVSFNDLAFGQANLLLETDHNGMITGKLYGAGFELELNGSRQAGCPSTLWFQGKGVVDGSLWVYDYLCYAVPHIPNGERQVPALVGSVTRSIPHPNSKGGINPAGVVASFYAVLAGHT